MAPDEEEPAEDERRCDLPPADRVVSPVAARDGEDEKRSAGDEVPNRHREERRQVADGDRERDERRSPDEVHGHEGEPDPHAVSRSHRSRMRRCRRSAQVRVLQSSISRADRADASRPRPLEGIVPLDTSLESNCRVELRRRDIPAPATRLGASGLPVRDLDRLLRRLPGRAWSGGPQRRRRLRRTASGSSASSRRSARSSSRPSSASSTGRR